MSISAEMGVGRPRVGGVYGRTPAEFVVLINTLKDEPGKWYIYSTHLKMTAAHTAASKLRHATPNALMPYIDHLEFKAYNHDEHGAVVLVRWGSGDTPS